MTTLPERLQEILVVMREAQKEYAGHHSSGTFRRLADKLEAAQSLQVAPEGGEAVAWLWLLNGKPMNVFLHRPDVEADHWTAKGFSVAPLYASPTHPAAANKEPTK